MYLEEDEILFNDFELKAIGNYLFKNLNNNNLDKDDFIHSYNNDCWEEGVNLYYDGRIDYYTTINDIDICFHSILKKNGKGKVEKIQQDLLKNNLSRIEARGGSYNEKQEILHSKEVKEMIEILDNVANAVYYQAGDISYWFDGFMR